MNTHFRKSSVPHWSDICLTSCESLTPALAQKFGYDSVEDFRTKAQKTFSLVETGIVHKKSSRLLLVNGTHDGLMPVEDSLLMSEYGSPKEIRYSANPYLVSPGHLFPNPP